MKITVCKDGESAAREIADIFAAYVAEKPNCVLGLATGSTPQPFYKEFIRREKRGEVDLSAVTTVNLDEYVGLAPDHEQSYRRFMQENLFDHVNIDPKKTFVPSGIADDLDAECAAYDKRIEELGGIDVQFLGIGHDGHIGFNEPGDVFVSKTHVVELAPMTIKANRRFFASEDDVPRRAVTLGIGTIMAARKIVLVVTGAEKREVLKKALFGDVTPAIPASVLQYHHDVTVICDEAASPF